LSSVFIFIAQFDAVLSFPERGAFITCTLYCNTLLGCSESTIEKSMEFAAFSAGLDLYPTPAIPFFKEVGK
jgi:hypothetical protein